MPSLFMPEFKDRRMLRTNNMSVEEFVNIYPLSKSFGEIGIISSIGFDFHCLEILSDQVHVITAIDDELRIGKFNLIPYDLLGDYQVNIGLVITDNMTTSQINDAVDHIVYWKHTTQDVHKKIRCFELTPSSRTTKIMDIIDDEEFDGIAYFSTNLYWHEGNVTLGNEDVYRVYLQFKNGLFVGDDSAMYSHHCPMTMTDIKQNAISVLQFLIGNKLYYLKNRRVIGDKKIIYFDDPVPLRYQSSMLCPNTRDYVGWQYGEATTAAITGVLLKKVDGPWHWYRDSFQPWAKYRTFSDFYKTKAN